MEQLLLTNYQREDLAELIMDCVRKVLNDIPVAYSQQEHIREEILTIEDVQKIFNVSKVTIHKWKKKGILPYYKMNRKLYFKRSEILNSMHQKKRKFEI